MNGVVEILKNFIACAVTLPVFGEAVVSVDGAGRDGGEEQQKGQVLKRGDRRDDVVMNPDDDIQTAEGHIGKSNKK